MILFVYGSDRFLMEKRCIQFANQANSTLKLLGANASLESVIAPTLIPVTFRVEEEEVSTDPKNELWRRVAANPNIRLIITSSKQPKKKLTELPGVTIEQYQLPNEWREDELIAWANATAQSNQLNLTNDQLQMIVRRVGNQSGLLGQTLQFLKLYSLTHPITPEVIELTPIQPNCLLLSKLLIGGKAKEALTYLHKLKAGGVHPQQVLATLDTTSYWWVLIKTQIEEEKSESEISSCLDNPRRLYFLKKEVQSVPLNWLLKLRSLIMTSDIRIKSTGRDGYEYLQLLIYYSQN